MLKRLFNRASLAKINRATSSVANTAASFPRLARMPGSILTEARQAPVKVTQLLLNPPSHPRPLFVRRAGSHDSQRPQLARQPCQPTRAPAPSAAPRSSLCEHGSTLYFLCTCNTSLGKYTSLKLKKGVSKSALSIEQLRMV